MEIARIHPIQRMRSLLKIQERDLSRSMKMEHGMLSEWSEEAEERNLECLATAKATKETVIEIKEVVEKVDMDEFSRVLIFSKIESIAKYQDRIVERLALFTLLLVFTGVFFAGENQDIQRVPLRRVRTVRTIRNLKEMGRREVYEI